MEWHDTLSIRSYLPQQGKPFFAISAREMYKTTSYHGRADDVSGTFECPHSQCSKEFLSRAELETHLSMTASHSPVKTVQRGVYDQLRIDWLQRFQSISLDFKGKSRLQKEVQTETTTEVDSLQMGWALHKAKGRQTRFFWESPWVHTKKKFDNGQKTGRKEDLAQVANDMCNARNTDNINVK